MIDPALPERSHVVDRRMLRQFAGLCILVFGALCWWQIQQGHTARAMAFGVVAFGLGPLGLVAPNTIRAFHSFLNAVTRPIGLVVTRLILGVMFYGLFTPVALVFRAMGRDQLGRRRNPARATYWIERPGGMDVRRYLRQF
jgi:hypothetical protein